MAYTIGMSHRPTITLVTRYLLEPTVHEFFRDVGTALNPETIPIDAEYVGLVETGRGRDVVRSADLFAACILGVQFDEDDSSPVACVLASAHNTRGLVHEDDLKHAMTRVCIHAAAGRGLSKVVALDAKVSRAYGDWHPRQGGGREKRVVLSTFQLQRAMRNDRFQRASGVN